MARVQYRLLCRGCRLAQYGGMLQGLVIIAVIVVLALAGYAGRLLWRLHRQRRFQREQEDEYRRRKREHEDYLIDSIHRIARGMLQDDLNLSEGVIRLTYLLDTLGLSEEERAAFSALDGLYEKVKGFDTHDARQRLSHGERYRQDSEREAHELEHREAVLVAARMLAGHEFGGVGSRLNADNPNSVNRP